MTLTTRTFTSTDTAALQALCEGPVSVPGDDTYAEGVSTWNTAVNLRPAIVVGAAHPHDVVHAVQWASDHDLPVGVNATGHGAVPNADGALLITTRRMSRVAVDNDHAIATVEAGARMGQVTEAGGSGGLAVVQGSSGSTGAVGYTLGGGLGVLSRRFGLAADHVVSIDVVTADGELRTVDGDHDADLYWALRGGRGNLGVVTSYRTSLQQLSSLYAGGLFFDGRDAPSVVQAWRAAVDALSESTSTSVALLRLPPDPQLPEPIRGRFVVHIRLAHVGDVVDGMAIAAALRTAGPVLLDTLGVIPAASLDLVHLDPPAPMPAYDRGLLLSALPETAVDAFLGAAATAESPLAVVEIRALGGAIAREPERPSAVPGRGAGFAMMAIAPAIPELAQAGPQAVEAVLDAVRPWRHAETLPTFLGRTFDPDVVRAAWPHPTLDRLLQVKNAWDPTNLFRLGHALLPAQEQS